MEIHLTMVQLLHHHRILHLHLKIIIIILDLDHIKKPQGSENESVNDTKKGLIAGAIIGIVLGSLVLATIMLLALVFFIRRQVFSGFTKQNLPKVLLPLNYY